jgi:RNA polymerase sigma-70 factor (ECF subfamily)
VVFNELTDKELAEVYQASANQEALATLYNRYRHLLFGLCYKYLDDLQAAEDALADIYIELVEKMLRHTVEQPKAWLATLARNHCLMRLRKEKRAPLTLKEEPFMQSAEVWHPTDAIAEKEATLQQMEKCIEQLKTEQQQAIRLFYLEQKCYNEIADITGLEWNKIRSHIQNGRRNLKICMDKNNANG